MKFEWFISWRYLKRRKGDFFLSAVTLIAVAGVAVGVMTVLVVLAVMTGFDRELEEKITESLPPLIVEKMGGIENYEEIIGHLEEMEHVISAAPFLRGEGLLKYGDRICGVSILGIDNEREDVLADISRNLRYGTVDLGERVRLENRRKISVHGILLGKGLAQKLGVATGARIKCISASLSKKSGTLVPSLVECEVSGVFVSGMYDIDSAVAYISLESARERFSSRSPAHGIEVKLDDIYLAHQIARKIERELGPPFIATSWMEKHRNLFSALRLEKTAMFIILALIILVAAFSITSTLIMAVMNKMRDVGILQTIGVAKFRIMGIFILEGLTIGLSGMALGAGAGFAFCSFLRKYPVIRLPYEIYPMDRLPVQMSAGDFISVCAVTLFLSLLATLYPAWRASRIAPVEALRYE